MRRITPRQAPPVELIVLDAHGVLFNNPFSQFLDDLAIATGGTSAEMRRLWREEIHDDAWLGRIDDEQLWTRLTGRTVDHDICMAELRRRYQPTAVVNHIAAWSEAVPLWILSNHRANWLYERLASHKLAHWFQRILVSEELGAMKPDPRAFQPVVSAVSHPAAALFIDDQAHNVEAAAELGLQSLRADPENAWLDHVAEALSAHSPR